MIDALPPGVVLILGALLFPLVPARLKPATLLALPVLSALHQWSIPVGSVEAVTFFDYELVLVRADALANVFATVFHIAAFLGALYSLHVRDSIQHVAALAYAGAAMAAVYAGDLITLFIFWEATAVTSVFLIWASRTESSFRAGLRYLLIQVTSGVLLLAGAIFHFSETGSLAFDQLGLGTLATGLIFAAFGIKAAFPFFHNWLQDAYPEATVTGTVFLSSFTTKLAIYCLARGFPGEEILIPIGAAMTAFPIFYAVIENDLRRVLAYSLNNQLGFMVVGVGIGTAAALNGAAAHAFAHIIYKGLLFMSMGAVLFRTGTIKGSELGGLYRSMPLTTVFCIVGAASISAFPLFSGFVAKSFVMTATAEGGYLIPYGLLLFASAGVFHHSGIKIPYFAFFSHDSGRRVKEAPWHMLLAMGIAAVLCIGIGVYPGPLLALLPYDVDPHAYTPTHVVTQLQLLLFSALAFGVLMRTGIYPPELRSTNLDFDWVYRRLIPSGLAPVVRGVTAARAAVADAALSGVTWLMRELGRRHAPEGILGEPWPTGTATAWAAVLLGVCLILFYL